VNKIYSIYVKVFGTYIYRYAVYAEKADLASIHCLAGL